MSGAQRHRVAVYAQFCFPDDNDPTYIRVDFIISKKNKINEKWIKKMPTISQVAGVFRVATVPSSIVVINCETGQSPFSRPVYTYIHNTARIKLSLVPTSCVRIDFQLSRQMKWIYTRQILKGWWDFFPAAEITHAHESQYLFFFLIYTYIFPNDNVWVGQHRELGLLWNFLKFYITRQLDALGLKWKKQKNKNWVGAV